jgi:chromosome segregation ATPase
VFSSTNPLFQSEIELGQLERESERVESECAACESALAAARKLIERQRADAPAAEARVKTAQEKRRETVARRTELQRLGNEVVESVEDARIRRRQVEQRAAGFRSAAAFAASARREAQRLENPERIARERLAEERASREAASAEAAAVEERHNEAALFDRQAEIESSIATERQTEIELTGERAAAARAATDLHEAIARLEREIEYGAGTLAHVAEELLRGQERRTELEQAIEEMRNPTDEQIAARVAALREAETSAADQRRALEALARSRNIAVARPDAEAAAVRRPVVRRGPQILRALQSIFAR